MLVRDAVEDDLSAIMAIHNDIMRTTTSIYDDRPTELAEWQAWYDKRRGENLPVIVADDDGEVAGLASYGQWRARPGYRNTVEDTVHVRADKRGRGFGRLLLRALVASAQEAGVHAMVAFIDSSAVASVRLHRSLGFEIVGTFREVATLRDQWLDLVAMQFVLGGDAATGGES